MCPSLVSASGFRGHIKRPVMYAIVRLTTVRLSILMCVGYGIGSVAIMAPSSARVLEASGPSTAA